MINAYLTSFLVTMTAAIAVPQTVPTNVKAVQYFKVKSEVIEGAARFNDRYLLTYHTGAGMNIADFTTNMTEAAVGYFNGSNLLFRLGSYDYALGLQAPEDYYGGTCLIASVIYVSGLTIV